MLLVLKTEEGAKECRWPLEAWKGKEMDYSLEPRKNTDLLTHLDFWSPALEHNKYVFFYATKCVVIDHICNRKRIQLIP